MFCHQCGNENPEDDALFCVKCGVKLVDPTGNPSQISVEEGTATSTIIGLMVVIALILFALPLGILTGMAFWAWKRPAQRRLIIWLSLGVFLLSVIAFFSVRFLMDVAYETMDLLTGMLTASPMG